MKDINELSNKTLNNYINKSGPIVTKFYTSKNKDDTFVKKASNRISGRHVARKKIEKSLNRMPALENKDEKMDKKTLNELSVVKKQNYLSKAQKSSDDLMDKGNSLLNKGDKSGIKLLYKSGKRQEAVNKTRASIKGKGLSIVKENTMTDKNIDDLLSHAINKQPIEFYEAMNSLLADKIEPILVGAKQELAKDIFKTFEEEKDEDDPSDVKDSQKNKRNDRFNMKKKFKEKQSKKDRELEEEIEQVDELSDTTLKSYYKKAQTSANKAWTKAGKEEELGMSTDGNKFPEKQKRHNDNASASLNKFHKRTSGMELAKKRLGKKLPKTVSVY